MALGTDLSGVDSIDYSLSETPSARIALGEALMRRYTTPKGRLITDTTYGYDIRSQVGASVNITDVSAGLTEQALAEEEVEDADVTVTFAAGVLVAQITVTDGEGPFGLTITANELTITALINGSPFWEETL